MKKTKNSRHYQELFVKNRVWIFLTVLFLGISIFFMGSVLLDEKSSAGSILPNVMDEATSAASRLPAPTLSPSPTAAPTSSSSSSSSSSSPASTAAPTPAPVQVPATTAAIIPEKPASQPEGIVWYDGYADPRTITAEIAANPEDLTILVNKYFAIPESYTPDLVLAESSKNQYIKTEANDAWNLMRAACEADTGYVLYLCSGYRTFEAQADLFSKSIRDKGIAHACSRNALEGRSEHNLGLALDISTTDAGVISSGFAETAAGIWVGGHCHEYGFILRYPEDKTSITGYVFEPWHYRYVGVDLAGTLYTSGQTLEEYYGKVPEVPADR
jgi:zinc D-Ala-D-Ala carboxypeptidase